MHQGWTEAVPLWVSSLRGAGLAPNTVRIRKCHVFAFAEAHDEAPDAVTIDHLASWLGREHLKANSRHAIRTSFRAFYGWMVTTERMDRDPSRLLRAVKRPPGHHRPAGELTVRRLWQHDDERTRLIGKLASIAGMRAIEISRVSLPDDLVPDLLGHSLRVRGKGDRVRVIPLPDDLAAELAALPEGWAFPNGRGGHLTPDRVGQILSAALPDGVTGHMLRHRAAGEVLAGSGWDLRATQEFLGHASVATTQIYTPARLDHIRRGVIAAAS